MFSAIRAAIGRILRKYGYAVYVLPARPQTSAVYERLLPNAEYNPWRGDDVFQGVFQRVIGHTLVDEYRCWELWELVRQSAKLEGALLEVGVWRGGTGAVIAKAAELAGIADPVILCDTFTGVVKTSENDPHYHDGAHSDVDEKAVTAFLKDDFALTNVQILRGIFPEETAHAVADLNFRFCHIDVDVYQSALDVFNWVWPRLAVGGIVVYDDYGFFGCDGVTRHVDELRDHADCHVIYNLNGHAVIVKIR
jgi:O-methyltransferase